MKYLIRIWDYDTMKHIKDINFESTQSNARKKFTQVKQEYKKSNKRILMLLSQFKDGKWVGFLRN